MHRVLAAIENNNVCVLGHPTGRLLNARLAMDLDYPTVFRAAGSHPDVPPGIGLASVSLIGYFGFLLVVLPVLGLVEKTKPIPASIADAVLAKAKPAETAAPLASR